MLHKDIRNWLSNKCKDLIQAGQPANLKLIQEELVDHFKLEYDEDTDIHSNSSLGISEEDLFFKVFKHIQQKFGSLLDD